MEILDLKNMKSEMKISLEAFTIRFELAKESISKLEDRAIEIIKSEEKRKKE